MSAVRSTLHRLTIELTPDCRSKISTNGWNIQIGQLWQNIASVWHTTTSSFQTNPDILAYVLERHRNCSYPLNNHRKHSLTAFSTMSYRSLHSAHIRAPTLPSLAIPSSLSFSIFPGLHPLFLLFLFLVPSLKPTHSTSLQPSSVLCPPQTPTTIPLCSIFTQLAPFSDIPTYCSLVSSFTPVP